MLRVTQGRGVGGAGAALDVLQREPHDVCLRGAERACVGAVGSGAIPSAVQAG